LLERKNSKFSTFSLGMKQRLAIASALLNDPEILILDEPTNGLDPKGIHEIRQIIQEISKTGTTILLASHLLDEVEKVCDHVIVLQKGKMLYSGPVDEMGIHSDTIIIKANEKDTVISELLTQIPGVTKFHKDGENWVLEVEKDIETHSVNEYFIKNKIVLSHLEKRKTKLEEKFLHLTSD
ncbi:MAG: ABC transporter ATP-binding protein, partial [Lutimonas sp.]